MTYFDFWNSCSTSRYHQINLTGISLLHKDNPTFRIKCRHFTKLIDTVSFLNKLDSSSFHNPGLGGSGPQGGYLDAEFPLIVKFRYHCACAASYVSKWRQPMQPRAPMVENMYFSSCSETFQRKMYHGLYSRVKVRVEFRVIVSNCCQLCTTNPKVA